MGQYAQITIPVKISMKQALNVNILYQRPNTVPKSFPADALSLLVWLSSHFVTHKSKIHENNTNTLVQSGFRARPDKH